MPVLKLTKSFIDDIPLTQGAQILYHDTDLKGFGLCTGKTSKTYFVQGTVNGRRVRSSIGPHGVFTPDLARQEAKLRLADMCRGINPVQRQEKKYGDKLTVRQAMEDYIQDRKKLKPRTINGYRRYIELYVPDWMDRPLIYINKNDILERHRKIGDSIGESTANKVMRVMRLLFNYADAKYGNIGANPCRYLSTLRAWYKEDRRQTIIKQQDLAAWYEAIMMLLNSHIRDYLILLLFTGMRKSEAARLRWEDVDFDSRTFTVRNTKNGDDLILPMSDWLLDFFNQRRDAVGSGPWVFPGCGKDGHVTTPRKSVEFVTKQSGVKFALHDLRRTFVTIAESLEISSYALKAMVNHRSGNDVTAGYIIFDVERLRAPMEKVSLKIEELILDGRKYNNEERYQGAN